MTLLRRRTIEETQLREFSKKTRDGYLRGVRQLAVHYGKPPDKVDEQELRALKSGWPGNYVAKNIRLSKKSVFLRIYTIFARLTTPTFFGIRVSNKGCSMGLL